MLDAGWRFSLRYLRGQVGVTAFMGNIQMACRGIFHVYTHERVIRLNDYDKVWA